MSSIPRPYSKATSMSPSFKQIIVILLFIPGIGMTQEKLPFFEISDTFSKTRFWSAVGTSTALYTGQTSFSFDVMRWTLGQRKDAMWVAMGLGTLFQGTIEILDGYSEKWGFSIYDIGFNTAGILLFAGQELAWKDQKFVMKISNRYPSYSSEAITSNSGNASSSPAERSEVLFGRAPTTRFIKDYNGQTIWLSMNVASFLKEDSKFPNWLNFAVGYGAENLYGGYANSWTEDEESYVLQGSEFQRASQLFLSLDIDLKRINTKKPFLRFLLKGLNVFKIPSPSLAWTEGQGVRFHALYW